MTLLDTLTAERNKFGAMIWPWDAVRILNAVAWAHRDEIQLVAAPRGGNGWEHPHGFIRIGHLADVRHGRVLDTFEDGPDREPLRAGPARPHLVETSALVGIGSVAPVKPIALVVPGEPRRPEEPARPEEPTRPEEPPTIEALLAVLLPVLEPLSLAVEDCARASLVISERLERLERDGVRIRFR